MNQILRVIVVDDEPLARDSLRVLLDRDDTAKIVAECADGESAVAAIREHRPDVVFLDIQMPGCDGFEVLQRLDETRLPVVVFVTAYDKYAVRAFDENALDYLLKPFEDDRFFRALERARSCLSERRVDEYARRILDLVATREDAGRLPERIIVRGTGRVTFVDMAAIRWISGAGNYAEIHTPDGVYLHRETLRSLEARLHKDRFARIHRSAIVNLSCVRELRSEAHGDSLVILDDGTEVRLSRRYRDRLERLLVTG